MSTQKGSDFGAIFRCLRCGRDLEGAYLPQSKSRLNRPGGQIRESPSLHRDCLFRSEQVHSMRLTNF